jgi:hypothetical protein
MSRGKEKPWGRIDKLEKNRSTRGKKNASLWRDWPFLCCNDEGENREEG